MSTPRWRRRATPPPAADDAARRRALGRATLLLGALVAVTSIGGALLARGRAAPAPPHATTEATATRVTVVRVVDGDTLEVRAAATPLRVRLYGIDATEVGDRCPEEATCRPTALAGAAVRLVPDARLTDPFGRDLRYVYADDSTSIDAALMRAVLARAWREDGAQRDECVALEGEARAARRGCLWSSTPATPRN